MMLEASLFVLLFQIFGWKPELYANQDELPSELIESLPEETRKELNNTKNENDDYFVSQLYQSFVRLKFFLEIKNGSLTLF